MTETVTPLEQPRNLITIDFKPLSPKYNMQAKEYSAIWQTDGEHIVDAFRLITTLPINDKITAIVGQTKDGYSYAGRTGIDPMKLYHYSRDKVGTLIHELTHRFIREYNLWEIARNKYGFKNEHQLLDLFLFDIIKHLYGEDAAMERIEHESRDKNSAYRESWDWFKKMSLEERQNLREQIVKLTKHS